MCYVCIFLIFGYNYSLKNEFEVFENEEWQRGNFSTIFVKTYTKDALIKTVLP